MSQTRFINPPALRRPPGYTHVVEVTAPARIVYIAGQLGVDGDDKVVGDFRRQAVQTFENLKTALAAARCATAIWPRTTVPPARPSRFRAWRGKAR